MALTEGKVWKKLLLFALPLLAGNVLQQCYILVDSILVGQYLGKEALAAISASYFIYYFIIALIIGVGSGVSIVISQYCGAKDTVSVQRSFSSFFLFMLVAGAFISVLGVLLAEPIFRLTQTPPEVIPQAVAYFRVYIGGSFLFIIFSSLLSILRGVGDSYHPMLFMFVSMGLNIVLDLLFILVLDWNIEGVAYATIIAQGISMCMALYFVHKHPFLSLHKKDLVFDKALFFQGLKIGIPTSVQHTAIAIGLISLLSIVNGFGTDTLTAYGAAAKVDSLLSQIVVTVSGALATFCAQNIGAKRMDRVCEAVRLSMILNFFFYLFIMLCVTFFSREIMQLFVSDPMVVRIGEDYLFIVLGAFFFAGATNMLNGALRGAGNTLFSMATSLICLWLIRIPLAYFLGKLYGTSGLWWAISSSLCIGFVATIIYVFCKYKKLLKPV